MEKWYLENDFCYMTHEECAKIWELQKTEKKPFFYGDDKALQKLKHNYKTWSYFGEGTIERNRYKNFKG